MPSINSYLKKLKKIDFVTYINPNIMPKELNIQRTCLLRFGDVQQIDAMKACAEIVAGHLPRISNLIAQKGYPVAVSEHCFTEEPKVNWQIIWDEGKLYLCDHAVLPYRG